MNQVVFDAVLLHHRPLGPRKAHYFYYTHRNGYLTWKKYVGVKDFLRLTRWNLQLAKRQINDMGQNTELIESLKIGIWHGWTNHGGCYQKHIKMGKFSRLIVNFFLAIS